MTNPAMEEIVDGPVTWRFDVKFLQSTWTCLFGRGCLGILDEPSEHLGQGCCSLGAELDGDDEAMLTSALAATLEPALFEHHAAAAADGVFADDTRRVMNVPSASRSRNTTVSFEGSTSIQSALMSRIRRSTAFLDFLVPSGE